MLSQALWIKRVKGNIVDQRIARSLSIDICYPIYPVNTIEFLFVYEAVKVIVYPTHANTLPTREVSFTAHVRFNRAYPWLVSIIGPVLGCEECFTDVL